MSEPAAYRINQPQVVHRTIEGEVVIINLGSGNYYSLQGSGARIWGWLEQGRSAAEILRALQAEYQAPTLETVSGFIAELRAESLVIEQSPAPPGTRVAAPPGPAGSTSPPVPFEKPALQKFDDMQELLLLDPIHEVNQAGWPHTPPGFST